MPINSQVSQLETISIEYLYSGLVLQDDIYNFNGTLLLIAKGNTLTDNLIEQLKKAHYENRLPDKMRTLGKYKLLVIDEIGYLPMDIQGANLFFQLIARRYERVSTVFTSNKTFSQWNEVFADLTIASAILDRVLHHCTVINIKGESYRLKERKEYMKQKQHVINTLFEQG